MNLRTDWDRHWRHHTSWGFLFEEEDAVKEWEEQAIHVIESLASQIGCLTMLLDKNSPALKSVRQTSEELAAAALGFTAEARERVRKGERL